MQISDQDNQRLHRKLPIDDDETILGVYRHHWFAYASNWVLGIVIVIIIMALAVALTSIAGSGAGMDQYKGVIIGIAAGFSVLILLGTCVPVYLRSQEQVVLTEEALLQMLQPSLFASKIDQINLQHITDVSVRQGFMGTLLGYGHITVETPGEQDNYEFYMLPDPHQVAKAIVSAHENYNAALQAGRIRTTLGEAPAATEAPQIDPQQYQQFLEYQRMVEQQKREAQAGQQADGGEQPPSRT